MGLDTRTHSSFWKDRAVIEINAAVLYSYQVGYCPVELRWNMNFIQSFSINIIFRCRKWTWLSSIITQHPNLSWSKLTCWHERFLSSCKLVNRFRRQLSNESSCEQHMTQFVDSDELFHGSASSQMSMSPSWSIWRVGVSYRERKAAFTSPEKNFVQQALVFLQTPNP